MLGGDRWGNKRKPTKAKPEEEPEIELEDELEEIDEEPYWLSRWCDVFELALGAALERGLDSEGSSKRDPEALAEYAREVANASILQMQFKYAEFEKEEREEEAKRRKEEEDDKDG